MTEKNTFPNKKKVVASVVRSNGHFKVFFSMQRKQFFKGVRKEFFFEAIVSENSAKTCRHSTFFR